MAILTRATGGSAVSNYESNVSNRPVQYFEKLYSGVTGAQEWIVLPDANIIGTCLALVSAGTALIEATYSPPSTLGLTDQNGNPLFTPAFEVSGTNSPQVVTLVSTSASSNQTVQGPTAIRANITSGTWVLSVRA